MPAENPTNAVQAPIEPEEGKKESTSAGRLPLLEKALDNLNFLFIGITAVLFVGFLALLFSVFAIVIDVWRSKEATYQILIDRVNEQNVKIDYLSKTLKVYGKK
jgi:hypothetical protein